MREVVILFATMYIISLLLIIHPRIMGLPRFLSNDGDSLWDYYIKKI